MKIFFDTEFSDYDGKLQLLSLGAVREDGERYYAERLEFDNSLCHPWVTANVVPHLTGPWVSEAIIRRDFKSFCGPDARFYAYYNNYDFYLLIQLYGAFMDFPWAQICWDLKCMSIDANRHDFPKQESTEHHAMNDALWNKQLYDYITI